MYGYGAIYEIGANAATWDAWTVEAGDCGAFA